MFSFCWNCFKETFYNFMIVLDAVVCGAAELYCIILMLVFLIFSVIHTAGLILYHPVSSFALLSWSKKNNYPGDNMVDWGGLQWARIGIGSLWRWVCHTGTVLTAPWCQKTDYMAWIRLLEISEEESVSNGSDPSFYLDNRTVVWSRCWEISPLTDSLINASQREAVIPLTVLGGLQECILEPRTLREQEKPS